MKKADIILGIMETFDENERLRHENERLLSEKSLTNIQPKGEQVTGEVKTFIDEIVIQYGKKALFDEVIYSYSNHVRCEYDEDTETFKVTPFTEWQRNAIETSKIPMQMSYNDFIEYFDKELKDRYEEDKKKSIDRCKEKMDD